MTRLPLKYQIIRWVLADDRFIEITEAEFSEIKAAKKKILFGLSIEEKIDLVLENYFELEKSALDLSLEHSIFVGNIESILDKSAQVINRRMANLLSTSKLYIDQIPHSISEIYGDNSDLYNLFRSVASQQYDEVLGYRVMEALRNHVQHRNLPIHRVTFPTTRDEKFDPPKILFRFIPSVDVNSLEEDKSFKKTVLEDLKTIKDKNNSVNILPITRDYIQSIGCIHTKIRESVFRDIKKSNSLIEKHRSHAEKEFNGETLGLYATSSDQDGMVQEKEYLGDRISKRWRNLISKNRHVDSIALRYVSSDYVKK